MDYKAFFWKHSFLFYGCRMWKGKRVFWSRFVITCNESGSKLFMFRRLQMNILWRPPPESWAVHFGHPQNNSLIVHSRSPRLCWLEDNAEEDKVPLHYLIRQCFERMINHDRNEDVETYPLRCCLSIRFWINKPSKITNHILEIFAKGTSLWEP